MIVGRYQLFDEIASGGMATVYLGRLVAAPGFSRTVAIKRLHPSFSKDTDFVKMLFDEARLTARVRHPNVVTMLDVVAEGGELCLVMEYVHGLSLAQVLRIHGRGKGIPARIAAAIVTGLLQGLHAAHEATDEHGAPLDIVHRDVSPQNLIVARDGIPKVLDFGIAKASGQLHTTREGTLKGKIPYMSPEQIHGSELDRRTDVYASAVTLWECLTGRPLFKAENEVALIQQVLKGPDATTLTGELPPALRDIVVRGLERERDERFATAKEMAQALEKHAAGAGELGDWLESVAPSQLAAREEMVRRIEKSSVADKATALAVVESLADGADATETAPQPPMQSPDATKHDASTNVWGAQETEISVSGDVTPPVEKEKTPRRLAAALLVLAATLGVPLAWLALHRTPSVSPSAPATATSTPIASASATATVSATPTQTASVIPSATVMELPTVTATSPPPATATMTTRPVVVPARCNPPTYLDENNVRRVKPGCGDHVKALR
jgi:serine/threonine-protein kinase